MMDKKSSRMEEISEYNFVCKCTACEEDWPTLINAPELGVSY